MKRNKFSLGLSFDGKKWTSDPYEYHFDKWANMSDFDIDYLLTRFMSRGEKIEYLEVNFPNEMDEFFKGAKHANNQEVDK